MRAASTSCSKHGDVRAQGGTRTNLSAVGGADEGGPPRPSGLAPPAPRLPPSPARAAAIDCRAARAGLARPRPVPRRRRTMRGGQPLSTGAGPSAGRIRAEDSEEPATGIVTGLGGRLAARGARVPTSRPLCAKAAAALADRDRAGRPAPADQPPANEVCRNRSREASIASVADTALVGPPLPTSPRTAAMLGDAGGEVRNGPERLTRPRLIQRV